MPKMNSDQCLDDIIKVLKNLTEYQHHPTITNLKTFNSKGILFDFAKFSEMIPIQRERGLFYLKVPSEDSDEYRTIVSSKGGSYISRKNVHKYLSSKYNNYSEYVFIQYQPYACNLEYNRGTLVIKGMHNYFISFPTPTFTILPAFKLPLSQWPFSDPPVPSEVRNKFPWYYAIPWINAKSDDDCTFSVCAPEWEQKFLRQQPKSIKIIYLMNRIRKLHLDSLPKLTHYMLKTVVLKQLPIINWQRDWMSLLSEMWTRLADNLRAGRLDSFLVDGLNLLDCMDSKELELCVATTRKVLFKILEARYNNTREDAKTLFEIDF